MHLRHLGEGLGFGVTCRLLAVHVLVTAQHSQKFASAHRFMGRQMGESRLILKLKMLVITRFSASKTRFMSCAIYVG